MRTIGASNKIISTQLIGEGLTLGMLSWLIAVPLSIPAIIHGMSLDIIPGRYYYWWPLNAVGGGMSQNMTPTMYRWLGPFDESGGCE